ncbi:MAG: flagellar hook assembly protein FlgD [Pseudomonadota bacterium]
MTVTAIDSAAAATTPQQSLTADFDMFLRLLTTQLQYQDPLDPMDTSEYTQQLVGYSQVEQAIQQTDKLDAILSALGTQDLAGASALIGRRVGSYDDVQVATDAGAAWRYELDNAAALTRLTVTDAGGDIVYRGDGVAAAGRHDFTWDGARAGETYRLSVTALDADARPVPSRTLSTGTVTAVEARGGDVFLTIGGREVSAADIISIS